MKIKVEMDRDDWVAILYSAQSDKQEALARNEMPSAERLDRFCRALHLAMAKAPQVSGYTNRLQYPENI